MFGREPPSFDPTFARLTRTHLGNGAWYDYAPAWLAGHESVFETLQTSVRWRSEERQMYDRIVDVPRLYAVLPQDGPLLPILQQAQRALSDKYAEHFARVSLGYYRDGRDSVAFHGDYVARNMDQALVATISVGAPRRFLIRPTGGGPSRSLNLGWGDLLVMGGTCQRTFQHAVPKLKHALPRIAIMLRPVWPENPR